MPQGGTVEVRCENLIIGAGEDLPVAEGRYVRVSIRDQGIGIPQDHLQRIFDPYFTTKQKGSGLGLATAYSILRKHGGFITVESEPAAGTLFQVYLAASQREPAYAEDRQVRKAVAGKGRVLLMDDELLIRNVAAEMLRHLGYTIEVASDGNEAIRKYTTARGSGRPFDIVILDLTVPGGMGGKEAVQHLRAIDPEVTAIASSGYSQDTIMSEYELYGFAGVVPKPYQIDELSTAVQKAMKTRTP
jgi:CheY-like chemotaxis protein